MGKLPPIQHLAVTDFGCIRNAELFLTPLHALIGPNDSGKSTLLRAVAMSFPLVRPGEGWDNASWASDSAARKPGTVNRRAAGEAVGGRPGKRSILRLDPDLLREPTQLRPYSERDLWFDGDPDTRGRGLSGLYDALLGRDREAFIALEDQFKFLFPTVKTLRIDNATNQTKILGLTLRDGTIVSASGMSEGMLYWLAFAIIEHLVLPDALLVEEPENGLHPARIGEVMKMLRKISERTQIIMATHSPLVINELQPEEVTIVTRPPERGTVCTPMSKTKDFERRSEIYALGELWLSFADGNLEEELVDGANTEQG